MPGTEPTFTFDEQDVLRRASVHGVEIDPPQLAIITKQLRGSLEALAAFDLREHKFSEPSNTFDARWK